MKTNPNDSVNSIDREQFGITKREYFASKAMQGILSLETWSGTNKIAAKEKAEFAVRMADSLIEALNKSES